MSNKEKKKDNSNDGKMLLIIAGGIFFFLILVVVANSSGGTQRDTNYYNSAKSESASAEKATMSNSEQKDSKEALDYCYDKAKECAEDEGGASEYLEQVLEKGFRSSCLSIYSGYSLSDLEKSGMSEFEIGEFELEQYNAVMSLAENLC